jgi:predicted TIM-barrel fold metal-dependent hydrolase
MTRPPDRKRRRSDRDRPREPARERAKARTLLIDVDVHPLFLPRDILPRLPERWRTRYANEHSGRGPRVVRDYPRWRNGGFRIDAAVPGGAPGSDLGLLRAQLLEEYDTDIAILIPLTFVLEGPAEYKAALCRAINDWLAQEWLDRDPRLRGSVNVPFDSPDLAVSEIERFADDPRFVQVMVRGDNQSEWGDRKYWPIYQAIEAAGFVAMCHVGGDPGNRYRGSGPPSYYLEQHVWLHMPVERLAMSLICEGVFDAYPGLAVALVEACLTWSGPLQWAMDAAYEVAGDDAPRLARLPSEYFREHFWLSTQPIEEPDNPRHLISSIEFAQMTDRVMFSSDYPHWDFDSPAKALPAAMPAALRGKIMGENAARLYARRLNRA